ncbi:MAG TPA: RDD family protein [Rubrivivax sp.]
MSVEPAPAPGARAPALRRRLACLVYEGVLLFGVVMVAGLLFGIVTQQRHALQWHAAFQAFLFAVLGLYFVWFWTHGGQTVAMKTWHIRLVAEAGGPVSRARAAARYVLSWVWFVPALASVEMAGLKGGLPTAAALLAGVVAYALLTRLHPQRQFWHDAVCATRLIDTRAVAAPAR